MKHLTVRVAWHDNRWNGCVCQAPLENPFCVMLERVREGRDDVREAALAGAAWSGLRGRDVPVCAAESGGFMNAQEWRRVFKHPYQPLTATQATHGFLQPTTVNVQPYTTFAVPFGWMLNSAQQAIGESVPEQLPPDEPAPFPTSWIFGRERQEALSQLFFGRLSPERSLVFFYCKEGQPLGDSFSRLVVGVGRVLSVGKLRYYDSTGPSTYPMWDRLVSHSIHFDGSDGFLLPYHDYLTPTGDPDEDARRRTLLHEIAVGVDPGYVRTFSYAAELASPDVALAVLVRCLETVRKIRVHGVAPGPWQQREEWLNEQIAATWKERGAFPGFGSALEAMGMRLGTALAFDMVASGMVRPDDDPWPVVDRILRGKRLPPQPAYEPDIRAVRAIWESLTEVQRNLLFLLSRFDLSPAQATRWFNPEKRAKGTGVKVTDDDILSNPYRIVETDLGDAHEPPLDLGVIDRGLLPDSTVAARYPVPAPSTVESPNDPRRVRAAVVSVLRAASEEGDTLLSLAETWERLTQFSLARPITVGTAWVQANASLVAGVVDAVEVSGPDKGEEPSPPQPVAAVQLTELRTREERLGSILESRATQALPSLGADWRELLIGVIRDSEGTFDEENERHQEALSEQATALERVTTRKLSVMVGKAGTGKTTALGALLRCKSLVDEGILLLAPTGKARVRLGKAAGADAAMTVAQFLNSLKRYDAVRQRPLFSGPEKHHKEKTVVIDECSMLTIDDLFAVSSALDLAHVKRIILVGDPNQLPPIGVGRPFADFVGYLEGIAGAREPEKRHLAGALGRLTVEVRTLTKEAASDTLRLASWFTREVQRVDADRILSELELGAKLNDLEIYFWQTPDELRQQLIAGFQKHLGMAGLEDVAGFSRALGIKNGLVPFDSPDGVENFQILSPVRMHAHGVCALNRWIQSKFRVEELKNARERRSPRLGDEEIVVYDKVIQLQNKRRGCYDWARRTNDHVYLANGEIGLVAPGGKYGWLNVAFAGRENLTVGYRSEDFPGGSGPLELAYAITVHKAQGSEFKFVFVILPGHCRLLSRELLYTALTRSRKKLVLLIEGRDASCLYDYSRPDHSETARRNTNLFHGAVRERSDVVPYAEHLIHRTEKGHLVRSKSELVIANMLFRTGLDYEYERLLEGEVELGKARPDFSFVDPAGNLILWEHLGMLGRQDYRKAWEWKRWWYEQNGFVLGRNLFASEEDERGALDCQALERVARQIQAML